MIYFDNAATTCPKPEPVYRRMEQAMREAVNLGRGSYQAARKGTDLADDVRNRLLALCRGQDQYQVVFSPSATIAVNQIIWGVESSRMKRIYLSPYEHNAVARTVHALAKRYAIQVVLLPVCEDGIIDLTQTAWMFIQSPPDLLCMTVVSNVTGYVLPIAELTALAKQAGAKVLLDGAQAVGLLPLNLQQLQPDYLVFAGHKTLYGPFGVGGFFLKKEDVLQPVLYGGTGTNSLNLEMPAFGIGQYEPGSPDYTAIAGLGAALEWLEQTGTAHLLAEEQRLTGLLHRQLSAIEGVTVLGMTQPSTGITAFCVDGYAPEEVGQILDEEFDLAVRTGYHCAPYVHDVIGSRQTKGCVRASVGAFTTEAEIEKLVEAVRDIAEER